MCRLEELEAMCFQHSCHSPFEKCIKAIVKLVGVGMGTQSHDRPPNLSGEGGRELLLTLSNAPLCHIIITSTMTDHGNIESCHFCDWFVLPRTETICHGIFFPEPFESLGNRLCCFFMLAFTHGY